MLTQIGAKPESDFTDPLGMLGDCHKRIKYFLQNLVLLSEDASQTTLDAPQRITLERALRYFQEGGPRHTADEEESLFPRLRAMKDGQLEWALAKVDRLEADHVRANIAHSAVDVIGVSWLANGVLSSDESARLQTLLHELTELYTDHLAIEDKEIFPVAGTLLSPEEVTALGQEMAARRGLSADIIATSSETPGGNLLIRGARDVA